MECKQCGAALLPGANFCSSCGCALRLEQQIQCHACGAAVAPNVAFCWNCGASSPARPQAAEPVAGTTNVPVFANRGKADDIRPAGLDALEAAPERDTAATRPVVERTPSVRSTSWFGSTTAVADEEDEIDTQIRRTPQRSPRSPQETQQSPTFVSGTAPMRTQSRLAPMSQQTLVVVGQSVPAPFRGPPPEALGPAAPTRVVVLGARGEPVDARMVEPGSHLDVGPDCGEPWRGDSLLVPGHARFLPAPGGGLFIEAGAQGSVFVRVMQRLPLEAGDELRVGQTLVYVQANAGGLDCVPMQGGPAKSVALGRETAVLGRERCEVSLPNDTFVSSQHCQFVRIGGKLYVEDLGSINGTYRRVLPGERVPVGSLLLLGQTGLKVQAAGGPLAS